MNNKPPTVSDIANDLHEEGYSTLTREELIETLLTYGLSDDEDTINSLSAALKLT